MSKRVRKWSTWITDQNEGMHSPVNYRKARQMLLTHPYRNGRLYHIVFTHSEERKVYRYIVDQLCKQLRAKGMPCRWKGCYERDKKKRFHFHMMILVEAKDVNPDSIIHYAEGHWLTELAKRKGVKFTIAPPDDPMHLVGGKQVNYMYVPKKAGPRLEDALIRISYLYKVRSKEGVDGQIYTSSTNIEEPSLRSADSPAAEETEQDKGTHEAVTTQEQQAIHPIGLSADQEGASSTSTSRESLVDARQRTSASEEGSGEASSPSTRAEHIVGSEDEANHCGAIEMKALTTAEKYVGLLYERAVDLNLDVDEVRRYLLEHGVVRTPGQVAWELEHVYEFHDYVATHQPKAVMSLRDWDKAVERA